jgi:glycosyltransferase involved in cell wall biosynthesis
MTFFDHPEWHEKAKIPFFQRAIKRSAVRADVLVCVSRVTAERLKAITEPAGEIVVVPHGVDHGRFRATAGEGDDAAQLARAGLNAGMPYILHLGTIEPRKGVVDLVRAFAAVAREVDDVQLVLAGLSGWGAGAVDESIADSPVRGRIRRLGYVDDEAVPALLRRAAVVAYPSYEEGFGLPALEALACGAPLVTTAGTAMAEVSAGAAWTCPAGDAEALASTITASMAAPAEELARRRQAGLEQSAAYTWQRTAEEHLRAYRLAAG